MPDSLDFEPTGRRKRPHRPFRRGLALTFHIDLGVIMGFPLLTTEEVVVSAVATDAAGDPDPNAVITFASSDASILAVTDNGDGSALVAAGAAGTAQVTATATDPSGNSISASADVDVSEPTAPDTDATAVAISFGSATPKA